MKLKKVLSVLAGASLLSFGLGVQADYVSDVDISGSFAMSGLGVFVDANPYTYTLTMTDVVGSATFNIPPTGTPLSWTADGSLDLTKLDGSPYPSPPFGVSPLPSLPLSLTDAFISQGPYPITGIAGSQFVYDFDNEIYTFDGVVVSNPSGVFTMPIPGMPNIVDIAYSILGNDITINFVESGFLNPAATIGALLAGLDGMMSPPTFQPDGQILGLFNIDMTITGASVPEPTSIALFGLGLLGMGMRRYKNAQA
ncbi:hypothetical protein A9Q88_00795 [Gammaproteobacteria bacterium 50_400_T64]|nr:hypothetical protein A9Q88_00795 [Gammaproteobacteria bacterium 50_400_T64]